MWETYEVRLEDGNRLCKSPHDDKGLASPTFECDSIARIEAFGLVDEPDSFQRLP
jgi:hypothetical protein